MTVDVVGQLAKALIEAEGGAEKINHRMDEGTFDAASVERLIREGVRAGLEFARDLHRDLTS